MINVRDKYLHSRTKLGFMDRIYLPAILKGMGVTLKHFLFTKAVTVQYPEERMPVAPRYRGRHVLKRDEQGRERCTACFCCETICPADAIHIVAGEVPPEKQNEYPEDKYARVFEVDLLRCIFCGFCQEVCPKAAIFLESEYELADDDRARFILTKEQMLQKTGGPRKIRV